MILPLHDDPPKRPRCSSCHAEYKTGQPIAHRPGCGQGGRGVAVAAAPEVKVKQADPGLAAELALAERLNAAGLVGWERQFYFATSERTPSGKPRMWRSDFAYPKAMLLVEVEGQVHGIKANREDDCLRASTAAALGYRMVRVTHDMVIDESPLGAVALVRRALAWGGT